VARVVVSDLPDLLPFGRVRKAGDDPGPG
jgi:hypothetical protein